MTRDAFAEWPVRFGRPGALVLERLARARADHGSVGPEDLDRIAREAGWPVAAVTGTASFYADFAGGRRGRRHVRVCEGTSCFATTRGRHAERLEAALGVRRGECAADGSVSLQGVYCLGFCYASPAAMDGTTPRVGPVLGEPAPEIPYRNAARRAVLGAGLTGEEEAWRVWPRVLADGSPERVLAEVAGAGLRGRGGAAFPAADKWSAGARGPAPRYVVANGDEGDPGSFADRLLMERDPHRVLEGLALTALAVDARKGFVLVRSEYPAAVERMRAAVDEAREAGHLGADAHGSGFDFDVRVVEGAGSYVAGEETALLRALQGLRGGVRPRPPYPTERGVAGRPTVVNNVETLAAVPWIVRHGGAAYAELGAPGEGGTKLVCLSERFRRPGVYEVEFGASLRFVVEELGEGLRDGHTLRALQVGGPLGGFLGPRELDLPLRTEALARAGVALGHGSLVAVDTGVPPDALLRHTWTFAASESCGACVPCRVGTRRGLELAERIGGAAEDVDGVLAEQDRLAEVMAVGSLCAFGRGVPGAVRSLVRVYHDELTGGGA
ncbi:NAD(P)H-dependent oxidoreductase subunit E [Nocardiopsis sp. EMB25]|uniref:NAD(P)H-dependent oxidoreductase subunit E n=1 Tax=Nocardiopsis sp. EMB25 TaxID=2835867 RepID=UPI0022851055|nr:NAD(P)H-dependent oxidoreductase subunit E [Nocardiopsis sp. EMB25]MCY9783442.1 NAD(P)H-dependent oxidoreductase subunit E [Nocardiopsis sp. EMB25]